MKLFAALTILTQLFATLAVKDCSKTDEWDAVVVGAGLTGSIIAAKLTEDAPEKCILILEGGKHSGQIEEAEGANVAPTVNTFFEDGYGTVHQSPETAWNTPGTYDFLVCWDRKCDYLWGEDGTNTPAGLYVGKLVGGSGAINGALMQYPPDSLWDPYPEGWQASDMKKYLDTIHSEMNATSFPSADGKHYNDHRGPNTVREAMGDAGYTERQDAAYWKPVAGTMGIPRVTTKGGRRSSSTSVYLKPVLEKNSNIQLWIETEVTKINLDESNSKATGLQVKHANEATKTIAISEGGLVVVSGGGVKTPQLLLQSEIGPDPSFKVINDAVGKSLTDKTIAWVDFKVPGVKAYDFMNPPEEDQKLFVEEGAGPLTQFGPLLVGLIDISPDITGDTSGKKNMVEFFVSAAKTDDIITVYFVHLTPKKGNGAIIHPDMSVSGDQFVRDFSEKSTNEAIRVVTEAMQRKGYESNGGEPFLHNMNHPGGTCALDECIDPSTLLVKGLSNVAVCDNSIVPEQATVHTAHTLMAIGLHGADILKGFWDDTKDEL